MAQEFNEVQKMGGGQDNEMLQSLKDSESTWNKISKHFKQFTDKFAKSAKNFAFNLYGKSVDEYARGLQELFKEAYFLEQWIVQLEESGSLNPDQQLLLRKLGRIA